MRKLGRGICDRFGDGGVLIGQAGRAGPLKVICLCVRLGLRLRLQTDAVVSVQYPDLSLSVAC